MYARSSFLCRQNPFLDVPLERKPYIVQSYQARAYRRLQLTHREQKAVESVRDESLCLRALWPVRSQGRFDCYRHITRKDVYFRAWREFVVAAFLPVEHCHRLPPLIGHHAVDERPRHLGLLPLEFSDALRHGAPVLTDADRRGDERADDRGVLADPFDPAGVRQRRSFREDSDARVHCRPLQNLSVQPLWI